MSLNAHFSFWSWKKRGSFIFKQMTRHNRLPGNQSLIKNFGGEKTEKELHWSEKASIYIQIAVWPQSEGFSMKILGCHLAVVMDVFYVCPWILRSSLRGPCHSFDSQDILKRGYFKLSLSIHFSSKYNIQERKYASTLVIYILCMWVIWKPGGLLHRRNFSNIGGIFY